MADLELEDSNEALQAKETAHVVPLGIKALFACLILWGIYYFVAYIGMKEDADLTGVATSVNIVHTIAYTAIPAAVVIALGIAMARRKKAKR